MAALLVACGGMEGQPWPADSPGTATHSPGKAEDTSDADAFLFSSIDEAVLATRAYIFSNLDLGVEWGGWITRMADGVYTCHTVYEGDGHRVGLPMNESADNVAAFHSHSVDAVSWSPRPNDFSDDDIHFAQQAYHTFGVRPGYSYLLAPNGDVLRYDPATGEKKVLVVGRE